MMMKGFLAALGMTLVAACSSSGPSAVIPAIPSTTRSESSIALEAIGTDYWNHELENDISLRSKFALPIEHLPDVSYAQAERDAAFANGLQNRLAAIDANALSEEERVTLGILKWKTRMTVDGLPFFYFQSPVTPYASQLVPVQRVLAEAEPAQYVRLLDDYPRFIDGIIAVLEEQQRRGIRLPKDEIAAVKAMIASFKRDPEQNPQAGHAIAAKLNRSLQRLLDVFDDAYVAAAPANVGLAQYPGGADAYRYLIRFHTTLNLTAEEIHRIGEAEIARINAEMQQVRDALAFHGTKAEFHQALRSDPRFFAKTPEEVGARLTAYVKKIEPAIPRFFSTLPKAPYDVRRLDPNLERTVTFGYYQWPTATDATGHYFYNGSKLDQRSLVFAAGLMCHELVPGHHFQIARQQENASLPPFRRESLDTAFVEGWGEYAATLGNDLGAYSDPYDRYGRLLMDAMIASRLVVDTGMNALGWSRERASQFLRENTLLSDTEIATETLRYSVDIPAQALAYKLGSNQILALRARARDQLGPLFDIREFHEWLLGSGSMPMPVLEEHVREKVREKL